MQWHYSTENINWEELVNLYRIAPLGEKQAADLEVVFANSRYKCFVFDGEKLIGAGRALADGRDCSYIADIAVHPEKQGLGIGREIVLRLMQLSEGHKKIILYSAVGKENFYIKLGFKRMTTGMAIWANQAQAIQSGLLESNCCQP